MYRVIITALTAFSFVTPALAATTSADVEQRRSQIGIQAGVNFENASTPSQVSTNTFTGFTLGANLEIPLAQGVAIQPELNYSRRGLNLRSAGADYNVYFHSVEVPVFGKVVFGEDIRPNIFIGPMATWNVSTEVQGPAGSASANTFNPRTFDMAAVLGVGVEVGSFFANARYILGILDIDENSADYKSRGVKVLAGLKF